MKPASGKQTRELGARFLIDTSWGMIEHDQLQAGVVTLSREELGRRFTAFIRNNCQLIIKGPSVLLVDRAKPFDPVSFIGIGWEILEQDKRALKITAVDFSKIRFESGLKEGESAITGEEKLARLKRAIRYDVKVGQALYEEEGQVTLRWLYDTFGITWIDPDPIYLTLGRSY